MNNFVIEGMKLNEFPNCICELRRKSFHNFSLQLKRDSDYHSVINDDFGFWHEP